MSCGSASSGCRTLKSSSLVVVKQTLETMVKGLVWHLDGQPSLTLGLHLVEALLVLQRDALLLRSGRADRVGDNATVGGVGRHLCRIEHRLGVGQHAVVVALPNRDLDGQDVVLQAALLPRHVLAVLVAVPDLLPEVVDDPLGVALLLGDVAADGPLLGLLEHADPVGLAELGGVAALLQPVVVVDLGGGRVGAVGVGLHLAGGGGDGGAGRLCHLGAVALHAVRTDVHNGGVVQDVAVAGDVDAVVVVAVGAFMMAAATGEGGRPAAQSGQNN